MIEPVKESIYNTQATNLNPSPSSSSGNPSTDKTLNTALPIIVNIPIDPPENTEATAMVVTEADPRLTGLPQSHLNIQQAAPAAPSSEQNKPLIATFITRLISNAQKVLDGTGILLSQKALSIMTVSQLNQLLLADVFVMMLGTRTSGETIFPDDVIQDIIAFGAFIAGEKERGGQGKTLKEVFGEFKKRVQLPQEKENALDGMLGNIQWLVSRQSQCLGQKVSDFFPGEDNNPSTEEVAALSRHLLTLQAKTIKGFNASERLVEYTLNAQMKCIENSNPKKGGKSKNVSRYDENLVLRHIIQFISYSTIYNEKYQVLALQPDGSNDNFRLSTLATYKNSWDKIIHLSPYREKFLDFLRKFNNLINYSTSRGVPDAPLQTMIEDTYIGANIILVMMCQEILEAGIGKELAFIELSPICAQIIQTEFKLPKGKAKTTKTIHDLEMTALTKIIKKHVKNYTVDLLEIMASGSKELKDLLLQECENDGRGAARSIHHSFVTLSLQFPPETTVSDGLEDIIYDCGCLLCKMENPNCLHEFDLTELPAFVQSFIAAQRAALYRLEDQNGALNSYLTLAFQEAIQKVQVAIQNSRSCTTYALMLGPMINVCHDHLASNYISTPVIPDEIDWFEQKEPLHKVKTQKIQKPVANSSKKEAVSPKSEPGESSSSQAVAEPRREMAGPRTPAAELFIRTETLLMGRPLRSLRDTKEDAFYKADALYHLSHVVALFEMIKSGGPNYLKLFIPELFNAIALLQEQVITPIYVDQTAPETVTHNLYKMCQALGFTTPVACNWGSQSFRYPNAHAKACRDFGHAMPAWLNDMVVLGNGTECNTLPLLGHALNEVKIGLNFVKAQLNAKDVDEAVDRFFEQLNDLSPKPEVKQGVAGLRFENLFALLKKADTHVAGKNDPELLARWNDLKIHAHRLKASYEFFKEHPEQRFASMYAKSIVMSAQYIVEHCGLMESQLRNDSIRTHKLSSYASLYEWDTVLGDDLMKILGHLDIEKGADYPNWTIWGRKNSGQVSKALELLSEAFEVATTAMEHDEGFQQGKKKGRAPSQVIDKIEKFLDQQLELMVVLLDKVVLPKL